MASIIPQNGEINSIVEVNNYEKIMNYLLFNQSIISEDDDNRLSRYIGIVKSVGEGRYAHIDDPLDRALISLFEVIIDGDFDPWDIDLTKFSEIYFKHIKENFVNIVNAGKLIHLAWNVLQLQSEQVLKKISPQEEDTVDYGYDYINSVDMDMIKLSEEVAKLDFTPRTLTLLDIVEEIENIYIEDKKYSKKNIVKDKTLFEFKIEVHGESITDDMNELLSLISTYKGDVEISFEELCRNNIDKTVRYFVAMLFLIYYGKIKIIQKHSYGGIQIRRTLN